ncbi:DUF4349 domain-containing protein, partial [Patescibacteria group bacterium]|nr:DUF4349 domain-containing protein [Patescibacteria group bacterium]
MPPFSMPSKKSDLLMWLGFVLATVIAIAVIAGAFSKALQSFFPAKNNVMEYAVTAGAPGAPQATVFFENRDMADAMLPSAEPQMLLKATSAAPDTTSQLQQRIIKTGDLSIRVRDAEEALEQIVSISSEKKGYIESSSITDPGTGPRTAYVTIRVPADVFETTLSELKQVGVLTLHESVHGQDVTAEFVDLEADLRNARAEETSYLEILKKSGSIEEVLAVTQQLAQVRGRIERLEGRKRYLENQTDLATISISLTEETRVELPTKTWRPLEVTRQALRDLVAGLQTLVDFLIRLVIAVIGLLIPIALISGLLLWLGWRLVRIILRRF